MDYDSSVSEDRGVMEQKLADIPEMADGTHEGMVANACKN